MASAHSAQASLPGRRRVGVTRAAAVTAVVLAARGSPARPPPSVADQVPASVAGLRLGSVTDSGSAGGRCYPMDGPVRDPVKVRLVNEMDSDHPMHHPFHLHGAGRFLVLARDGVVEDGRVIHRRGSPRCPARTSSACPGSTPAARPCSASSMTTPPTSPTASPPASMPLRRRGWRPGPPRPRSRRPQQPAPQPPQVELRHLLPQSSGQFQGALSQAAEAGTIQGFINAYLATRDKLFLSRLTDLVPRRRSLTTQRITVTRDSHEHGNDHRNH